jgi:hypothetical protein
VDRPAVRFIGCTSLLPAATTKLALWMKLPPAGDLETVPEQRNDGCEALLGSSLAAGQVHDQGAAL